MNTLFPLSPVYPEGFEYIPDFITGDEEEELIAQINKIDLHPFHFQGFEAKRKVASFGFDYSFDQRQLSKGKEMPPPFIPVVNKVAGYLSIAPDKFRELLLTEYPEGAMINWHRDAPPFDVIAGISLASDCTFKLRPHDKSKQGRGSVINVPVARRSLYIISGVARADWQHSIAAVKHLRYSITLRTLRKADVI